ncbi:MAG TPA: LPS assembly lipoprotein LptE [Steroidobacteraceae bacterium]|nr:LPS assembly lipoprotein LptE [Steroidobacteraceae bacterium]
MNIPRERGRSGVARRAGAVRVLGAGSLAGITLLLCGCGFHLEGRYALPQALATVRIDAVDPQSEFYFGLRRALLASGAHLTDDIKDPGAAVVHVLADSTTDVILTVSSLNVPTEYELTYLVRFSVEGAGGKVLVAPEQLSQVRDYNYSESDQLAKQREQQILSAALGDELAGVVMRRLSSLQQKG